MKLKSLKVLLVSLIVSTSAYALDLNTARSKGLVKELPSGYIRATDDSAKDFVKDVNKKRKAHYSKIAKKNKASVAEVATQAAKKIQKKLESK